MSTMAIHRGQWDVLSAHALKRFEDRMVLHLEEYAPAAVRPVSDDDLRRLIRDGIRRAAGYDVVDSVDVERYLELMIDYGAGFDTAEETRWAGDVLRDSGLSGSEKISRLDECELFLSLASDAPA